MTAAEDAHGMLARAKVNLTLQLRGQRADGYHLLHSLVVFPGVGDRVWAEPAVGLSLSVSGPFGDALSAGGDNLILHAAEKLAALNGVREGAALHLEKNLPVASGIGGGSSDAAATLAILEGLWGCEVGADLALSLGADVPVCCAAPQPHRMEGIGERVSPVTGLPTHWMVLVNPLVGVPTGAVFAGVADKNPPAAPDWPERGFPHFPDLIAWLAAQRNDLQAPAIQICPIIAEVLSALSDAPLARMSGSGATCFAVHADEGSANLQAEKIRKATPWWVASAPVPGSLPVPVQAISSSV